MSKVDYNMENMMRCLCGSCPVQSKSDCAKKKMVDIQEMESKGVDTISELKQKDFPWFYCSIGKTNCNDINFEEECYCKNCEVWKEYNLENSKPMEYFCKDGKQNKNILL